MLYSNFLSLLYLLLLTFMPCVAGRGSDSLKRRSNSTVSERIFLAQKYYKIFNFFSGANGSLDVLDGVLTLLTLALSRKRVDENDDDMCHWHGD